MIKAIIIEDEIESQLVLTQLLSTCCQNVELIGVFTNVNDTLEFLEKNSVNLIFLDIELSDETGFALLDKVINPQFKVIFTTAYNQHALLAFKYSVIDYLLKPIGCLELQEAVSKVQRQEDLLRLENEHRELLISLKSGDSKRVAITHQNGFDLVDYDFVLWFEAQINYTIIHLKSGSKLSSSRTLKLFEDYLDSKKFIRISRSALVNIDYITKFNKKTGLTVTLIDNTVLQVSESRKDYLLSRYNRI